jgi:hypothetical protein
MVSRRRQNEHDMDPLARGDRLGDRGLLRCALPDDRLERADVRLDLHQHDLVTSVEPDVRRPTPRTGDRSLHHGMPARVAPVQDRLHGARVSSIVDQRGVTWIDRDPEVTTQGTYGTGADPRGDVRIALLHTADDRARDTDRASHGRLTYPRTEADLADLLAEVGARPPKLAVTVVDRESADPAPRRTHGVPPSC